MFIAFCYSLAYLKKMSKAIFTVNRILCNLVTIFELNF